jgi:hypothetical protein
LVPAAFAAAVLGAAAAESPTGGLEAFGAEALVPVVAVSADDEAAALLERAAESMDATPEVVAVAGLDACPGVAPGVVGMPKPAGDFGASPDDGALGAAAP